MCKPVFPRIVALLRRWSAYGVTTRSQSPLFSCWLRDLLRPATTRSLSQLATFRVKDQIARRTVSERFAVWHGDYAMRVWIDPPRSLGGLQPRRRARDQAAQLQKNPHKKMYRPASSARADQGRRTLPDRDQRTAGCVRRGVRQRRAKTGGTARSCACRVAPHDLRASVYDTQQLDVPDCDPGVFQARRQSLANARMPSLDEARVSKTIPPGLTWRSD